MSEIEDKIKEITKSISDEVLISLRIALLQEWERTKETVVIFPTPSIKEYPSVYLFGILAKDWPGLLGGIMGVMVELGCNIEVLSGITITYEGEKIAIISLGIQVNDKWYIDSFLNESNTTKMKDKLYKICLKGWRKGVLLAHGARKIEIFEEVLKIIERLGKLDSKVTAAVTKFFDTRDEEYLEQRTVNDLATLILTNYEFVDKVRKSGGEPQVKVEHIKVRNEERTGISIVCFDRDFSLPLALDAIKNAVSYYNVKYDKEYVTYDGISVYRIEIDGFHKLKPIERSLIKKLGTRKLERLQLIETFGGLEHYARVIIPKLVKEHSLTNMPQVYISTGLVSEQFIQFKLIVVKSPSAGWVDKYVTRVDKIKGFSILSFETPKLYGNSEVCIFDLRVDAGIFSATEFIYTTIRKSLEHIIGKFRDFDEGMRELDVRKFREIMQKVKGVDTEFLREIYYGIEDFYRSSAPTDEITALIKLGTKLAQGSIPNFEFIRFNERCVLLGVVSKEKILSQVLSILTSYETTASKIQLADTNLLLLKIGKQDGLLSGEEIKVITHNLSHILHK